jgi:hypothetical protein
MQDPVPPPTIRRTCPRCNRPVEPGYKFCETCGTKIPELSTCSKCGTQFITPLKYCDLCGAPLILEKVTRPEGSPERFEEVDTGPVEDPIPGQDDEEIPEPETDELPEDTEEEIVTVEDEIPRRYKREIQEPDTAALLEEFGKEYDVNETLESSRKPKPPSPGKQKANKPVAGPSDRGRASSETVDEALLLSSGKPSAKAGSRISRTWVIGGCIALIAIIAAVYFIGMPILAGSGGFGAQVHPGVTPTPEPTITMTSMPTRTPTPGPAPGILVPQPTQTIPTGQKLYFYVQKSPITAKILVTFAGSAGHGGIQSADIRVTHPDGSVATGVILPLKGVTEIILDGSKETDRVEIIVLMSDGGTYRVYDDLVPLPT